MGFGKDGKGQILYDLVEIDIGGLAADDLASTGSTTGTNLLEDFRILKTEYFITTVFADSVDGPIVVGMAAGGLSAPEVEECIESTPTDLSDVLESEQVMRPVWPLETFVITSYSGTNELTTVGKTIAKDSFTPKWTFTNPSGWSWWAYNNSNAALAATGRVYIFAKHYGVWVR